MKRDEIEADSLSISVSVWIYICVGVFCDLEESRSRYIVRIVSAHVLLMNSGYRKHNVFLMHL
jgi:hypothetical protein